MTIRLFSERFLLTVIPELKVLFLFLLLLPAWFFLEAQNFSETNFNENQNYASTLRYQGKNGNDLIFYDAKGVPLYLQYRVDRWDFDAEKKIADLRPGAEYKIDWTFKGYREESAGRYQGITQNSQTPSRIRQTQNIPVGIYIAHKALLPQKIIY